MMLLSSLSATAQESQTVYNFLRLPVSAHAAALGGDNITIIEDDPSLMFNNPSLIASVSDKSINLNFMTYMSGAFTGSASFTKIINDRATWAASAQYMDYGTMKQTSEYNEDLGTFSAREISVGGYFAYTLFDKLAGGIAAKFITSYIGSYNSMAVGVDLGLNYYDDYLDLSASVVAKNLGGQIKAFNDDFESIPLDLQVGVTKRFTGTPFRASLTFVDLNHWGYSFLRHSVVGLDIILGDFYIAAGYNARRAYEMKITDTNSESGSAHGAGLSLGAGLQLERFKVQLAYAKYHISSSSLLINLTYSL